MDRKAVIVLIVSFLLLVAWYPLVNLIYPPAPLPAATNEWHRTGQPAAAATNAAPTAFLSAAPTNLPPRPKVDAGKPEQIERLVHDGITYLFTSHGGGLKAIELDPKKYPQTIRRKKSEQALEPGVVLNRGALAPVLALGGHPALEEDGYYDLQRVGPGVRAVKTLSNGLHIVKEFLPGTNYLVQALVRIENRGREPVILPTHEVVAGTASLVNSKEEVMQLGVFVRDPKRTKHVDEGWFANRTLGCFPGTPRPLYRSEGDPVTWVASHNRFFALAAIPATPAAEAVARKVDLPLGEKDAAKNIGIEAALIFRGQTVAPGTSVVHQLTLYAGPKEYNGLARLAEQMKNDLDHLMKFNGFFGFFSKVLLLSMNGLHDAFKLPYGLAIIVITIIIKLLFWPLTKASTRSMKRLAELQPEMNKIREKYKDDPQKMNRKMMEFMKEHKVSPLGGCLPMLIQIPVFFGFYFMIQSAIELRGASFLWAWDLSVPDTVATLAGFPLNPLPLIMGATMFWQAKLTPPSPGMDPTQQKIMQYMPLIFLFVLYNMSSGLTLYWTVQNILTIVQTKITKTKDAKTPPPAPAPAPAPASRRKP